MSTDWEGPFKKLFEAVSDSWLMLPVRIRGIGDEILRVSNRVTGKIGDTRDTLPLLRKLGADRSEAQDVEEAVTALLAQGFLSIGDDGGLYVTNLADAQEKQRAKWRERQEKHRHGESRAVTHVTRDTCEPPTVTVTPHLSPREERRREEKRSEEINPPTPQGGSDRRSDGLTMDDLRQTDETIESLANSVLMDAKTLRQFEGLVIPRILASGGKLQKPRLYAQTALMKSLKDPEFRRMVRELQDPEGKKAPQKTRVQLEDEARRAMEARDGIATPAEIAAVIAQNRTKREVALPAAGGHPQ